MLDNIRQMINQRKAFQEAASIIFEDGVGNLDDQIVLGEEDEKPEVDPKDTEPTEPTVPEEGDEGDTPEENDQPEDTPTPEPTGDDVPTAAPVETEPVADPPVNEPEAGDTPMPLPTGDGELPTPVGKQTGEPIEDPDDLLDVSIDLKSNTIRDVLPVPPSNAAEALGGDDGDDLLNTRIDSGFGGEDEAPVDGGQPEVDMTPAQPGPVPTEPQDTPTEGGEESGDQLTEAITLGNDVPAGDDAGGEPPADAGGAEGGDTPPDDGAEPPADENSVTAAVKDKVDEITSDTGDNEASSKDDLLKKLGNITKSLEDAKKAVMNTLQ